MLPTLKVLLDERIRRNTKGFTVTVVDRERNIINYNIMEINLAQTSNFSDKSQSLSCNIVMFRRKDK